MHDVSNLKTADKILLNTTGIHLSPEEIDICLTDKECNYMTLKDSGTPQPSTGGSCPR